MNDILVTCYQILAWCALIGGLGTTAYGICGLIIAKRENKIKLAVNNFTDANLKEGDDLERAAFAFNEFYDRMNMLDIDYPQFVFADEFDVKHNEMCVHIYNENRSRKLASFCFDRDDVEYNPDACIDKIVGWCSNYISQKTCCENRLEPKPMKPMTCEKCGAPLKGCECEYCGTRYYIPNVETTTFWADNKQVMQVEKELNQAKFDAVNQTQLNEIQNMVNQLRLLGGNGSIEYMLSSGAINATTARDMYMTKMANYFNNYGGQT